MKNNNSVQNSGSFRRKTNPFTQVSNLALKNEKLSLKAKGLYALIQCYITIPNFVLTKSYLMKLSHDGEYSFDGAWAELKKAGFLKIYKINSTGGFIYEYDLLDEPILEDYENTDDNTTSNKTAENTDFSPEGENQGVGKNQESPEGDFPPLGNSSLGLSTPGKPPLYNNTGLNNTYNNNTGFNNQSVSQTDKNKISNDDFENAKQHFNKQLGLSDLKTEFTKSLQNLKLSLIDSVEMTILDMYFSEVTVIKKETKPQVIIRHALSLLTQEHIRNIIDKLFTINNNITNKTSYLKTVIYSMAIENNVYYANEVAKAIN